MQYIIKGNFYKFSAITLIMFYIIYVSYMSDYLHGNDIIIKQHKTLFLKNLNANALILGGSNALMGLSAEDLSYYSKLDIVNLTLLYEGGNENNYFNYVLNQTSTIDRNQIRYIFYSTIDFYTKDIKRDKVDLNNENYIKNYIEPPISFAAFIKYGFDKNKLFTTLKLSGSRGDLYYPNIDCEKHKIKIDTLVHPNIDTIFNHIIARKNNFKRIFPNAKFVIIAPPVLTSKFNEQSIYIKKLDSLFYNNNHFFISQEMNSYDETFFADAFHVNKCGRTIRTKLLFDSLISKSILN